MQSLWNQIAHERVQEQLKKLFFRLAFGLNPSDAYQTYSALVLRLKNSASKTPSRELEEAVSGLENTCVQDAFQIYEAEAPQKKITNVNLLWSVYSLGLVPFIETAVLRDTCLRLDHAQPSLGLNLYRPNVDRFLSYESQALRREFPVVLRIVDGLKAHWRDEIREKAGLIHTESVPAGAPREFGDPHEQPQPAATIQDKTKSIAPAPDLGAGEWPERISKPVTSDGKGPVAISATQLPPQKKAVDESNWEDIEILFLSDERVQITVARKRETLNYAEFGFQDHKTKNPTKAWAALRKLAESRGVLRTGTEAGMQWRKLEKRVQEIRKVLRKHFRMTSDPIPFVEGTGYQARFRLACGPSFNA